MAARGLDVPGIEHIVNFDLPGDGGSGLRWETYHDLPSVKRDS